VSDDDCGSFKLNDVVFSRMAMPHATKRLQFSSTEVICYLGHGGRCPIQSWYRPFFQIQEP
jgi:hypothetical protein